MWLFKNKLEMDKMLDAQEYGIFYPKIISIPIYSWGHLVDIIVCYENMKNDYKTIILPSGRKETLIKI
jgi:hypothetical protein